MQWNILINGQSQLVKLPDQIPDNTEFIATLGDKPVALKWQRSTRTLFIKENTPSSTSQHVWRAMHTRTFKVSRFPGEPDLQISAEFGTAQSGNIALMDVTAGIYMPGQDEKSSKQSKKPKVIRSQITGKIIKLFVKSGDTVKQGDTLMIIEAMKMENRVLATCSGALDIVKVREGESVSTGAELARFKSEP